MVSRVTMLVLIALADAAFGEVRLCPPNICNGTTAHEAGAAALEFRASVLK